MQKQSAALLVSLCVVFLMVSATPTTLNPHAQAATPAASAVATVKTAVNTASNKFGDLTTTASFFPSDTLFYASIRTDDNFVQTADALLSKIEQNVPESVLPTNLRHSLSELLDLFTQTAIQQPFSDVRKWLGSSAAFGLNNANGLFYNPYARYDDASNAPSYAVVFTITDQQAATAAVEALLKPMVPAWTRQEHDGNVQFDNNASYVGGRMTILVRADSLIFGSSAGVAVVNNKKSQSLNDSVNFRQTLALLPAPSYNAVMYIDLPRFLARAASTTYSSNSRLMGQFFSHLLGPQAYGATILNDNTLTIDLAQRVANTQMLDAAGLKFKPLSPIHPDFAALMPSNTVVGIQGANLAGQYDTLITNAGALWDFLPVSIFNQLGYNQYIVIDAQPPTSSGTSGSGKASVERLLRAANVFVTGATGLTNREAAALFSGDYLFSLTANPSYSFALSNREPPFEFVAISQVTAPIDSQSLIDTLSRQLQLTFDSIAPSISTQTEIINGTPVLVMSTYDSFSQTRSELLFGVNKSIAVFGLRRPVTAVLNGSAANASASNMGSAALLLNEANVAGYWNPTASLPLVDVLYSRTPDSSSAVTLRALIQLFSGATFSVRGGDYGDAVGRMTLSLK